jgi:hypothetical protein
MFIAKYNHQFDGNMSVDALKIHSADMSRTTIKPKHPPRTFFSPSDPKIILRRKPLPRKDLEKSEKNSLAKSRFL